MIIDESNFKTLSVNFVITYYQRQTHKSPEVIINRQSIYQCQQPIPLITVIKYTFIKYITSFKVINNT